MYFQYPFIKKIPKSFDSGILFFEKFIYCTIFTTTLRLRASGAYAAYVSSYNSILIFSDEMMQQDFRPTVEEAIEVVVEQCTGEGYIIGAFVDYNTPDQALWVDLTQSCGGFIDYLSPNPQQMINTLNYWIGSDCWPN